MLSQVAGQIEERKPGTFVTTSVGGESVRAFVPSPLPPDPPVRFEGLYGLLEDANRALGRLDGVTSILPDTPLFLYMYVRKEALLSSQIEGTQSSLSDLLLFESHEAPGVPLDDVQEVSNYVAAMTYGLERLRDGFPLSLRLIREIHGVLLESGRGSTRQPGEFRRSQNWIGGTRPGNALYVPPPPNQVMEAMGDLENFVHAGTPDLPLLVKAALVHLQFESIHPFLDGNGRLGRLLITFMLCANGALKEPILYLSLYFKSHRQQYYDLLQRVREQGDWEAWLEFFLTGIKETSDQATETARQILALFEKDRIRIESLGRPAASALRLHQYLQTRPLTTVPAAVSELSLSPPTVRKSVGHLVELGIVRETTGRQRGRLFVYDGYLG
ncbi:MAG TPA: Fic family protein, partial [Gammaproteobacteria bacterium]|nr:Fic family protein [Gammaproteobacteria bacterium]